jgi:hypothetical protein
MSGLPRRRFNARIGKMRRPEPNGMTDANFRRIVLTRFEILGVSYAR